MYIPLSFGWPLMVMVGLAVNGTFPMMLWLPLEMVPKESVGTASGLVLSFGYTGGLVGPLLAGYIMDATGALHLTLVVLGGVGIGWALVAFLLPETGYRARGKS
jgi:cyanate permease